MAGGLSLPKLVFVSYNIGINSAYLACAPLAQVETKDHRCCKLAVCHVDVDQEMSSGHRTAGFAPAATTKKLAAVVAFACTARP